jgi:UDP-N-acetylmuramoylalanine--D-glutamate ligase
MTLEDLKNKKIGILGYGVEGKAVANYLQAHGLDFFVFDLNTENKNDPDFNPEKFILGPDYLDHIYNCEILFRSPGIRSSHPRIIEARAKGAIVTSQIKFFFENCRAKIIGITGTKGKSTTSKLAYEILLAGGLKAHLGGNFGAPIINLLEEISNEDYIILELSSFQLQDLEQSPHVGVVLMIEADHLDYHENMEEYVQAKSAISKYQSEKDSVIYNIDNKYSTEIGLLGDGKKFEVQTIAKRQEKSTKVKKGFLADQEENCIYWVDGSKRKEFIKIEDVPLRGFHNMQNVCSAALIGKILNISDEKIIEAIKEYKGIEHRLEFVIEKSGIEFYNDSISTTPESALAAIRAFDEPEVVIMGGSNKYADYAKLAQDLVQIPNVKALVLLGEVGDVIFENIRLIETKIKLFPGVKSMDEAFEKIKSIAEGGDVVLLAPATASFGMFKNYRDRGQQFKEQALKYV